MIEIISGVLIGLFTSFLVGLLLMWKGQSLVDGLRQFPSKRKSRFFARVYVRALTGYPFRGLHVICWSLIICLLLYILIFSCGFVYFEYRLANAAVDLSPKDATLYAAAPIINLFQTTTPGWISVIFVPFAAALLVMNYKKMTVELLVPFAQRELGLLRSCVVKVAAKEKLIEFMNSEGDVRDQATLLSFFLLAKSIIGNQSLKILDEMIKDVSFDQ